MICTWFIRCRYYPSSLVSLKSTKFYFSDAASYRLSTCCGKVAAVKRLLTYSVFLSVVYKCSEVSQSDVRRGGRHVL